MRITQPVLIQSLQDEFELTKATYKSAGTPGLILRKADIIVLEKEHKTYQKGVGKLVHLGKRSRPDILNLVCELTRQGSARSPAHFSEMLRVMKRCVDTKKQGLLLKPESRWDGSKDFLFDITGHSNSTYASCKETMLSTSVWSCELNGAGYVHKSKTQRL